MIWMPPLMISQRPSSSILISPRLTTIAGLPGAKKVIWTAPLLITQERSSLIRNLPMHITTVANLGLVKGTGTVLSPTAAKLSSLTLGSLRLMAIVLLPAPTKVIWVVRLLTARRPLNSILVLLLKIQHLPGSLHIVGLTDSLAGTSSARSPIIPKPLNSN